MRFDGYDARLMTNKDFGKIAEEIGGKIRNEISTYCNSGQWEDSCRLFV